MNCPYCTTTLPVDSTGDKTTCPKCGSEFIVSDLKKGLATLGDFWDEETYENKNKMD